jgi:hypothetical protein
MRKLLATTLAALTLSIATPASHWGGWPCQSYYRHHCPGPVPR